MRRLIVLVGLALLPLTAAANQLNKCIDARGAVTYSNLPCRNAQEARTVEIDPAPVNKAPARAARDLAKPAAKEEPAQLKLETQRTSGKRVTRASSRQCDAIADKLGAVLDKMDQARRQGYTPAQAAKWDEDIRALERKKQQAGCF
jgi:hypothetical protein